MAERVTLENRQRGKDAAVRSDELRARIESALFKLAGRRTTAMAQASAREEFCRYAVRAAKRNGLRCWSSGATYTAEDSAMKSLQTLLGEKKTLTNGRIYTGSNVGWVLDIWEATLDYYFSDSLLNYLDMLADNNIERAVANPNPNQPSLRETARNLAEGITLEYIDKLEALLRQTLGLSGEINELLGA